MGGDRACLPLRKLSSSDLVSQVYIQGNLLICRTVVHTLYPLLSSLTTRHIDCIRARDCLPFPVSERNSQRNVTTFRAHNKAQSPSSGQMAVTVHTLSTSHQIIQHWLCNPHDNSTIINDKVEEVPPFEQKAFALSLSK
jgi:hypothetical protein